jgi:GntR family transcriptional regulator / MocR family aminotransferase
MSSIALGAGVAMRSLLRMPNLNGQYNGSMKNALAGVPLLIAVDRDSPAPLHKQVYDGFRAAILRGELRAGEQIPSSRKLAADIRISRFPVLHAYAQLLAEGYFETRVGSGTFVSRSLPEQMMSVDRHVALSGKAGSGPRPVARRVLLYPAVGSAAVASGWGAFNVHQPALDQFPFQVWSSLVTRHSRNPQIAAIHHIHAFGSERFREAICAYLRTARAVKCEPDQIMVVSGSQQALDLTARVLLNPGDAVFVEEPGYNLARTLLTAAGCRLVPIPVDSEGMDIARGIKRRIQARAALVTPSHQFPLGSTMSLPRRLRLLNWAQTTGAWIIEDDYDSEYRFESKPIASLQGLDANNRVIYIGTFSKVLFPSLRIGYLVIPGDLLHQFAAVRVSMDIFPPYLFQEVLADFISLGHFGRHIRKMRQLYRERRTALTESLQREFGDLFEVLGAEAGMHLAAMLPESFNDQEIAARAVRQRLWLRPVSPHYGWEKPRHGFVLGYGSTSTDQIPRAVERLRSVVMH